MTYNSVIERIDPKFKAEWVTALRSGDYKQTEGMLHRIVEFTNSHNPTPIGYCCLGVACDLDPDVVEVVEGHGFGKVAYFSFDESEMTTSFIPQGHPLYYLNHGVVFQMKAQDEPFDEEDEHFSLVDLNDNGFTFSQIADIIDYFL